MINNIIDKMLEQYQPRSLSDYENALKEIIQQITLLALWRAKFFEHAVFYGGSSLRILYGLNRFSEDLDFSLIKPLKNFSLETYKEAIVSELRFFGLEVDFKKKIKKVDTSIESAFLKANTLIHILKINANLKTHPDALIQVKIEVDTDPAQGFSIENKILLNPITFSVQTMDLPSLFSGKMHALLCRKRIRNVKGRDWYDLIWYVRKKVSLNRLFLENKIIQSHSELLINSVLTKDAFEKIFLDKVDEVDFQSAIGDIRPFLKTQDEVDSLKFWNKNFFAETILPEIKFL